MPRVNNTPKDKDSIRIGWEYTGKNQRKVYNRCTLLGCAKQLYCKQWEGQTINGEILRAESLHKLGEKMVAIQEGALCQ